MLNYSRNGLLAGLMTGLVMLIGASVYGQSLQEVMQQRGLTENDLLAAAKTYHPSGQKDDYVVFSSGGQSGQVIVYGVPSMRILKYIAVFTTPAWIREIFFRWSCFGMFKAAEKQKDKGNNYNTTRFVNS